MNNFNGGAATLGIISNINDVQRPSYNNSSFKIKNTGNKKIAKVVIDVSEALYPDTVFDPFGQAGDTISKALTILLISVREKKRL